MDVLNYSLVCFSLSMYLAVWLRFLDLYIVIFNKKLEALAIFYSNILLLPSSASYLSLTPILQMFDGLMSSHVVSLLFISVIFSFYLRLDNFTDSDFNIICIFSNSCSLILSPACELLYILHLLLLECPFFIIHTYCFSIIMIVFSRHHDVYYY